MASLTSTSLADGDVLQTDETDGTLDEVHVVGEVKLLLLVEWKRHPFLPRHRAESDAPSPVAECLICPTFGF